MSQADTAAIEEHDREDRRALRTLARVSVAVNTDLDLGRVLRAVVDAAVELTGASSGLLYVRSGELVPDGPAEPPAVEAEAPLTLVARSRGLERPVTRAPTLAELLPASKAQLSVDGAVAVADATAEPFTAPRALAWVAREEGARAVVAAPAVDATGLAVGVLVLLHDEVGKFGRREERFAVGLAGQAASALQRSRLFRDEARARRVAERSAARLALLQDITSALA